MNHAIVHLREELRRLKQQTLEITHDYDLQRCNLELWRLQVDTNSKEIIETVDALRTLGFRGA